MAMKTTHTQLLHWVIFATTLAVAGSAFGQTPTCAAPGCNSVTGDIYGNTASGSSALAGVEGESGGQGNTAFGLNALYNDTTGFANTASGEGVLFFNTTGAENTASGFEALVSNTTGSYNTAS